MPGQCPDEAWTHRAPEGAICEHMKAPKMPSSTTYCNAISLSTHIPFIISAVGKDCALESNVQAVL